MRRMSRAGRRPKASEASEAAQPFGAPETGRLTWLGLAVAAIGWVLLIAVVVLGGSPPLHGDMMVIAQALIGSGFALGAIGALQSGFGALDRFFNAALHRSGARAAARSGEPGTGSPVREATVEPVARRTGRVRSPYDEPAEAAPRRSRPYRTFPDGSVEVETILGTRRFATMGDAREFI